MVTTLSPRVISSSDTQFLNAISPIEVTELPRLTSLRNLQSRNAPLVIDVTPSPIVIFLKELQLLNAFPIFVTEDGRVTSVKPVFWNA